jgi:hypothetical protein
MSVRIRARFDGKVLVPEVLVDLPQNQTLELEWKPTVPVATPLSQAEWETAFNRLLSRAVQGVNLPAEALRRESIYADTTCRDVPGMTRG